MAIQADHARVVQTSDGQTGDLSPMITLFVRENAHLRCQINQIREENVAVSLAIGYGGSIAFHGKLSDLWRLETLFRTSLEEYDSGPT